MTASDGTTSSSESPARILVVDDNLLNREMLIDFLQEMGWETDQAEDGAQAMDRMREAAPDAVLLDLEMPVKTGFEVLTEMQSSDDLRHIPVIIISGKDDIRAVSTALESGAEDFMPKPFNPAVLKSRLSASLERKALRDRERQLLAELEKSYADLQKAEAGRDALTHMVVHDLGNPLAVIRMNTEMLDMTAKMGVAPTAEALSDRLAYIASASSSMDTMIRSMLDISKMETGQLEPTLTSLSPGSLLLDLANRMTPLAADKGMTIEVEAADGTAEADHVLLDRIVSNLLANAFKYAAGADTLRLAWVPGSETGEVIVEDNGEGIPEELHDRIFEKFYQVEAGNDGAPRAGVGLGLAFCRMASEVMGGSIRVESASPNGTRFVITLPLGS